MIRKTATSLAVLAVAALSPWSAGATCYIRAGAAGLGNGSDWHNAYPSFAAAGLHAQTSTAPRGNTYYVAGASASYGAMDFRNAASGDLAITIKKATEQDHGTSTGWDATYGTLSARFSATVLFRTSNWVFDGVTGGGPGRWDSGHGFYIGSTIAAAGVKVLRIDNMSRNITVRHTDMCHETDIGGTDLRDHDTFYCLGASNVTLSHCALRHAGRVHFLTANMSNVTIERCYMYRCKESATQHAESWSDQGSSNVIIRNCLFKHNMGTGVIVVLSRGGDPRISDNWQIYGNVFLGGERTYDCTDGIICVINSQIANNWRIYNNSFVNLRGAGGTTGLQFHSSTGGGHAIYNNIWYNCQAVSYSFGAVTAVHDYDLFIGNLRTPSQLHLQFGAGDPFASIAGHDFNLKAPTAAGKSDLGPPFDIDPYHRTRGRDGVWDRGACEFGGAPAILPEPPTNPQLLW